MVLNGIMWPPVVCGESPCATLLHRFTSGQTRFIGKGITRRKNKCVRNYMKRVVIVNLLAVIIHVVYKPTSHLGPYTRCLAFRPMNFKGVVVIGPVTEFLFADKTSNVVSVLPARLEVKTSFCQSFWSGLERRRV